MQEKDVVSKNLFKRITLDIARILLGLEVDMKMLEILSSNRNLYEVVKEEQTMLSEVLIIELSSYGLGMEHGMERGEQLLLSRLLQKRFGSLPPLVLARLKLPALQNREPGPSRCWTG
ncbi:hypothetical protein ACJU26_07800 [Acidithiobacillus sp. M4-SHS-6]|uniref:hypothetical protein n=1 Tax=Acidithiobacillus sp. M4-SHS-6 TaxID=3383024 RepID=UPI0039BDF462